MATTIMRKHEFNNHPLFLNFLMFLGEFFIGFLFIIELKLSESIMNKNTKKNNWCNNWLYFFMFLY